MISIQLPPEVERHLRAVAAQQHRDVGEVASDLVQNWYQTAQRQAFNEDLKLSIAEGLAGDVISEEESLAELEALDTADE